MDCKFLIIVTLMIFAPLLSAQEVYVPPTQDPSAAYRLFNTQNIYTFLKLDTRTGKIWQVQWGEKEYRFSSPLNLETLAKGGSAGRFTLYPTKNMYTFVLLDQKTGATWQVQWGNKEERFMVLIR